MKKLSKSSDLYIAILFSAIVPLLNIMNNIERRENFNWQKVLLVWFLTFSFLMISWYISAYFAKRYIYRRGNKKMMAFGVIFTTNLLLLFCFTILGRCLSENSESFYGTILDREQISYFLIFWRGLFGTALINLVQYALYRNRVAQEVAMQNEQLKTQNILSQFELLRQQVNPHFLFNALSTLRSMIHQKDSNSEEYVMKLSEVFRQLLQKKDKDVVTLEEELEFANSYIYMLLIRFEHLLNIQFEIDDEAKMLYLPTFSLQILIENCTKHNVISQSKPLHIRIHTPEKNKLVVENNLQPKQTKEENSGFGLSNLQKRYALLREKEGICISMDKDWYSVTLKLMDL
ncbi:MAG: signal transduction histidine kinase LytS [Bacteroidetes bacterium]|jgi:two-component system, LytTR family, sensor kinase|nr:signal transduction histidine kinase LytS [Bacteroidota bacterium]